MRQSLVPVLLLTAVALSSSNVLPVLPTHRLEVPMDAQQNDNILRNILRYNTRNDLNNIFYTMPVRTSQNNRLLKKETKYMNTNNDRARDTINSLISDDDNYDGEGFRKEQWHNYPRQLDRLHEYLLDYRNGDTKRSDEVEDPDIEDYGSPETVDSVEQPTNEYILGGDEEHHNSVVDTTNPLLILKVHLTCLSNRLKNSQETESKDSFQTEFRNIRETNLDKRWTEEINPAAKVKREGVTLLEGSENSDESSSGVRKTVNKRLFSLWSRLQTLSHKGHELPHRRHLAYYGFPTGDSEEGGALTAETRATLMRPPGSPLRWG